MKNKIANVLLFLLTLSYSSDLLAQKNDAPEKENIGITCLESQDKDGRILCLQGKLEKLNNAITKDIGTIIGNNYFAKNSDLEKSETLKLSYDRWRTFEKSYCDLRNLEYEIEKKDLFLLCQINMRDIYSKQVQKLENILKNPESVIPSKVDGSIEAEQLKDLDCYTNNSEYCRKLRAENLLLDVRYIFDLKKVYFKVFHFSYKVEGLDESLKKVDESHSMYKDVVDKFCSIYLPYEEDNLQDEKYSAKYFCEESLSQSLLLFLWDDMSEDVDEIRNFIKSDQPNFIK